MIYRVSVQPKWKKSIEEVERWTSAENPRVYERNIGWRWGSYILTVTEEELKELQEWQDNDSLEITAYENWELESTWDSVWCDWSTFALYSSKETNQDIKEELEEMEDAELWLETQEYHPEIDEVWIHSGVKVEVLEQIEEDL
jgi:hypothetical protein